MKYDCVVIGAGLSGLAAAVRLSHFGKKVLVCERHFEIGGLNSYYSRNALPLETGLHAMTNFAAKSAPKSLPLPKLLRQLRIPYDDLSPREQNGSKIVFPEAELAFTNDFANLADSVADAFPGAVDEFMAFDEFIRGYDGLNVNAGYLSAREILRDRVSDPLLVEMLFCPLMYYGSAVVDDMDFAQFAIMYKSVFHEGFCRPARGIRGLLELLTERFKDGGGEILDAPPRDSRFPERALVKRCPVAEVNTVDGAVRSVVLESGALIETERVLSCAGAPETQKLIRPRAGVAESVPVGELGFVETLAALDAPVGGKGCGFTITFFNESADFAYHPPEGFFSPASGVVCCPDNFKFESGDDIPPPQIRVTMLANPAKWRSLRGDRPGYAAAKSKVVDSAVETASRISRIANLADSIVFTDAFTPNTIERFTGRVNGAIYGSPEKRKDGTTEVANLFLCGTDQGFLGITGSMLSGISMANMHLLT
jgi:phytoene dehydrogenase-like protein